MTTPDPIPDAMAAIEQLTTMYKMVWTPLLLDVQNTMLSAGIRENIVDSVIADIFRMHLQGIIDNQKAG